MLERVADRVDNAFEQLAGGLMSWWLVDDGVDEAAEILSGP